MSGGTTKATTKWLGGEEGGSIGVYCPTSRANGIEPSLVTTASVLSSSSSSGVCGGGAAGLQHVFPLQMTAALLPRFALMTNNNIDASGTGGAAAVGSTFATAAGQPAANISSSAIIAGLPLPATHFSVVPGAVGAVAAGALVGSGVSIMQANAGTTGPIIIRQQPQIPASTHGVQRVVIGAQQQIPTGRVLVNSNPPRTLLKTQIIQPTPIMPSRQMAASQPSSSQLMVQYTPALPQQQQPSYQHQLQPSFMPEIQHTEALNTTAPAQIIMTTPRTSMPMAAPNAASKIIVITTTSAMPAQQRFTSAPIMQISKDVVLTMSSTTSSNLSTTASTSAAVKVNPDQEIRRILAADIEKQESLLKLKPKQIIVLDNQNIRANIRSKSLQDMKTRDNFAKKRRLSTSAIISQQIQTLRTPSPREENKIQSNIAATAAIDLVEYDEEEYIENSDNVLIIDEGVEEKAVSDELNADTAELEDIDENADVSLIIVEDEKIEEPKVNNVKNKKPLQIVEKHTGASTITTPPPQTQLQHDASNSIDATNSSSFDDKSLLCDEKILAYSSTGSMSSTSNSNNSLQEGLMLPAPLLQQQVEEEGGEQQVPSLPLPPLTPLVRDPTAKLNDANSMSSVLNMLSNFNTLRWKERIGTARGTSMRFELNEFNLVQIHERCAPRHRIHTAYEKAIYERETRPQEASGAASSSLGEPLLYLCRRCSCHGPATEFLAPEFCSLECLKRDSRKRNRDGSNLLRKRPRKDPMLVTQNQKNVAAATASTSTSSNALTVSASNASTGSAVNTNAASVLRKSQQFRWSTYLTGKYSITAAPIDLFINPFPTGPHHFKVGMKVEAIDPSNCALFCVCTIVAVQGYRLKLNIDGYDGMHDFWLNADSMDIFPPGYCQKYGRVLQAPRGMETTTFSWMSYLAQTKARAAHRQLFTHLNSASSSSSPSPTRSARNRFRLGMQLEAEDLNDTGKLCVATVCDTIDERIRVHFDGYASCYDYWVAIDSPYIHPCGWHEGRAQLIAPPDMHLVFNWRDYLLRKGAGFMPAPAWFFKARKPIGYKSNMKLEVIDPRNPSLIRPATIIGRKGHRVKLHLDGWQPDYCFWLEDDSPDLHPIGWCDVTGHDLEPPPGYIHRRSTLTSSSTTIECVPGCRGVGNSKRFHLSTHTTRDCCPYAPENWRVKNISKPARVIVEEIVRRVAVEEAGGEQAAPMVTLRQYLRTTLPPPLPQEQQEPTEPQQQPEPQPTMNEAQILARLNILDNLGTRAGGVPKPEATLPPPLLQQPKRNASVTALKPQMETHKIKPHMSKSASKVVKPTANAAATAAVIQNGIAVTPQPQPTSLILHSPSSPTSAASSSSKPAIEIPSELRADYGPQAEQNYALWLSHLGTFGFDPERIQSNPLRWSTAETSDFVKRMLKCSKTASGFAQVDIDGAALLQLQQSDLTEQLGLKLGPAVKLYSCILQLRMVAIDKYGVRPLKAAKNANNAKN